MIVKVVEDFGRKIYRKVRFHKNFDFWMYVVLCAIVLTLIVLVALEKI